MSNTIEVLKVALRSLDKIDDYFEYSNESLKDRHFVRQVLSDMNKQFTSIQQRGSDDNKTR